MYDNTEFWNIYEITGIHTTSGSINQYRSLTSYRVEHLLAVIHWDLYMLDKCLHMSTKNHV